MAAENNNLFYMVMEAEGDNLLQPFDAGGETSSPEAPTEAPPPDTTSSGDNDNPPPLEETSSADALSFPGEDGGGENQDTGENTDDGEDNAEENKEDEQLSQKASNVLNKTLYDQFVSRNQEVDDIVNNLQIISAVLPIEIVKENEEDVNKLKSALTAGQNYVIEKFVYAQYGENALYFRKLDALYTLLMDRINSRLKSAEKNLQPNNS